MTFCSFYICFKYLMFTHTCLCQCIRSDQSRLIFIDPTFALNHTGANHNKFISQIYFVLLQFLLLSLLQGGSTFLCFDPLLLQLPATLLQLLLPQLPCLLLLLQPLALFGSFNKKKKKRKMIFHSTYKTSCSLFYSLTIFLKRININTLSLVLMEQHLNLKLPIN